MMIRYLFSGFLCLLMTGELSAQKSLKRETQNIVVVTIDGLRWQEIFRGAQFDLLNNNKNASDSITRLKKYWSEDVHERKMKLMPFLWNVVVKNGQLYGNRDAGNFVNVKNPYWFSYPGRSESFAGFVDTSVNSNDFPDHPNTNVFEFLNQQKKYNDKVVGFASWNVVAKALNRNRSGMLVNVAYEDLKDKNLTDVEKLANESQHYEPTLFGASERVDASTFILSKAYIQSRHPKVIYLDLGDTDEYAHEGEYENYLDAIHNCDAMISSLWNYMQQDVFYKGNTTFVIVPDHGRGEADKWTDHGADTPHSNETWFIAMGPDTPALGEVKTNGQIYNEQFAQTIASLLGFTFTAIHPVAPAISGLTK